MTFYVFTKGYTVPGNQGTHDVLDRYVFTKLSFSVKKYHQNTMTIDFRFDNNTDDKCTKLFPKKVSSFLVTYWQ